MKQAQKVAVDCETELERKKNEVVRLQARVAELWRAYMHITNAFAAKR